MGRTSIKNKLILCFLSLILIVMVVVTAVNLTTNQFVLAQAVSTALALAVGIVFGSLFSNSLVKRLNHLSRSAEQISGGDLTREIQVVSRDEVRNLEEYFSMMVIHIRGMLRGIVEASGRIQKSHETLMELTRRLSRSSENIDKAAKAIAKGSERQSLIVQKTTAQLEQGIASMDELIQGASQTVEKVSDAMKGAKNGEKRAKDTLDHLEHVLKQMSRQSQPIQQLSGKIEKIKVIINVMDGIAQKTDLLSLNASIEATRAGESGKGFALVAEEIRSMADSSKRSSQQIRSLIEDILEDNQDVMKLLGANQEEIGKGRRAITGIVHTLSDMLTGVGHILQEVQQMENITRRQVKDLKGQARYFKELADLASKNYTFTQKTAVATESQKKTVHQMVKAMSGLNHLSQDMAKSNEQFRLPEKE